MADSIVINGRTVASNDLNPDASSSDYILLRTKADPLRRSQKKELSDLGVTIHEFVGNHSDQIYLCSYPKDSLETIRALDYIDYANIYASKFAVPMETKVDAGASAASVDILLQHDVAEASDELIQKIAEAADIDPSAIVVTESGAIRIEAEADAIDKIAAVDEVRVIHTVNEHTLFNNEARQILRFDVAAAKHSTALTGKRQIVCVADTGFDKGSLSDVHDAFAGRVQQLWSLGRTKVANADDPDGHGTHVCGSILGSGQHDSQGLVEGTAPGATLMVQSMFSKFNALGGISLGGIPQDIAQLFHQAYDAGARIHNNSWGSPLPKSGPSAGVQRVYDGNSEAIDNFVWNNQDMAILFAAGNDGQDAGLNGVFDGNVNERSLGSEAAAKNCITVGATENNRPDLVSGNETRPYTYGGFYPDKFSVNPLKDDHQANNPEGLAAFSSRGPTAENRLKPDVVAPGTAIPSARSRNKKFVASVNTQGVSGDNRYMYLSGTSMATPLVAGCCAVLRQALFENGYRDEQDGVKNPTGALLKALLINGAVPISGQYMPGHIDDEPNPHSGFGRVDLSLSLMKPGDTRAGYGVGAVFEEDEAPFIVDLTVPKAGGPLTLKVTLTYADLPGGALQNDLNLVVIVGNRERHGNQFNKKFDRSTNTDFDRCNNVEQIVWPNLSGNEDIQIVVKPYRFMSLRVPFAYAWRCY